MYQTWAKLLFLHWPIPANALRRLIPDRLSIDTYDDTAWIAITPFTMWGIRASFLPAIPGLRAAHELNVRTYVHLDGEPGVWFFSLDISHPLMVPAARLSYRLPYYRARIAMEHGEERIDYRMERTHPGAPAARFRADWRIGGPLGTSEPGSLEFFLTERYRLYAARAGRLYTARIFHRPWTLRSAELGGLDSSMIESHGLPTPTAEPLLHYSEELRVEIWPPKRA